MIYNGLIAVMVVLIPIIWSTKGKGFGLFTALLAAICALAAGAIAFAAWEPVAMMLMDVGGDSSSAFGNAIQSNALAIGLLFPYILTLGLLRMLVDSLVPANLEFDDLTNTVGGVAFGAVVSVISVGVLATSASYLRLGPDIMGYTPIEERDGSPVYASKLWIPVDQWTIGLYEHLSRGAFSAPTPLALHRPQAHVGGHMQRMTFKGASRNTLLPSQFSVLGTYKVAGPLASLTADSFMVGRDGKQTSQKVWYPDGTQPAEGATLQGYVVKFNSGAKERVGNTIMGAGQIRLIARTESGSAVAVHPIACIAPPEAGAAGLYRFRFEAPEVFIASKGGASEVVFAFEFLLPQGATPLALFVKNIRVDVSAESGVKESVFPTTASRDAGIRDRSVFAAFGAAGTAVSGPIDKSASVAVPTTNGRPEGVEMGPELPEGMMMNKTNRGSLVVDEGNFIVDGEHTLPLAQVNERALDKNLRVSRFFTSPDIGIVKVRLSTKGARSLLGASVETAEKILPPLLIDDKGAAYEAVGFVYGEGDTVRIRYSPGRPLRALSELPALSRAKTDQTLWLIFAPTRGARIKAFNLGNKEIVSMSEGFEIR